MGKRGGGRRDGVQLDEHEAALGRVLVRRRRGVEPDAVRDAVALQVLQRRVRRRLALQVREVRGRARALDDHTPPDVWALDHDAAVHAQVHAWRGVGLFDLVDNAHDGAIWSALRLEHVVEEAVAGHAGPLGVGEDEGHGREVE